MTDCQMSGAGFAFDQGLKRRQAAVVEDRSRFARLGEQDAAVRNRADAVIDQEDKSQGEQQKPEKPQQKPDHDSNAQGRRRKRTA